MSLQSKKYLVELLNRFPSNIQFAFAYGSSIFKQTNNVNKENLIDLVLITNNSLEWHRENLIKNSSDYSFLKYLGPKVITDVQRLIKSNVYYNTLIKLDDGQMIKYGVIDYKDFIDDLLDWKTLYISGRLHKPVKILRQLNNDNKEIENALLINKQSAIHLSLLLLNEQFTEEQLFMKLTSISYTGDFRMIIGEDKNKIENIVKNNLDHFRLIYSPYLNSDIMKHLLCFNERKNFYLQNCSSNVIYHHLSKLPKTIQKFIYLQFNYDNTRRRLNFKLKDLDDTLLAVAKSHHCSKYVTNAVRSIVLQASVLQTMKGFFTAGLFKSFKYSSRKLLKMYKSVK